MHSIPLQLLAPIIPICLTPVLSQSYKNDDQDHLPTNQKLHMCHLRQSDLSSEIIPASIRYFLHLRLQINSACSRWSTQGGGGSLSICFIIKLHSSSSNNYVYLGSKDVAAGARGTFSQAPKCPYASNPLSSVELCRPTLHPSQTPILDTPSSTTSSTSALAQGPALLEASY